MKKTYISSNSDLDPYFSERNPDPKKDSLKKLSGLIVENDLDKYHSLVKKYI